MSDQLVQPVPKRGRKPKSQIIAEQSAPAAATQTTLAQYGITTNLTTITTMFPMIPRNANNLLLANEEENPKGKVVTINNISSDDNAPKVNVILHLKCSLKDLQHNQQDGVMEPYMLWEQHMGRLIWNKSPKQGI